MGTWKPGAVETIERVGRRTVYRVRWTNPLDGRKYGYEKLTSVADGEDFRAWLIQRGGRVTRTTPELVQGTWRGGDVETIFGDTRITFGEFARKQVDARNVSDRTRKQLHSQLKNYFAELDGMRMLDIDEAKIREVLASLREPKDVVVSKSGKTKRMTLSPSTVVHYSWFLWGIFTAAVKAGTITAHPFGAIELAKPENVNRRLTEYEFCLSVDNYTALMKAAAEFDAQTLEVLRLILHTGLRIGEALALQVRHVDFENGQILVRQQLNKGGKRGARVKPVKKATEEERSDSERNVPVEPTALSALAMWLVKTGTINDPNAYVFARPRCIRHSEPWVYESWHGCRWSRVLELAKLDYGMPRKNAKGAAFAPTPHCLRHTFASRMLNAGLSVYDVSKLLGHKDTKVTERIYLHSVGGDLHKRAKEAAKLAFPSADVGGSTSARNGWITAVDGSKKRRGRAA